MSMYQLTSELEKEIRELIATSADLGKNPSRTTLIMWSLLGEVDRLREENEQLRNGTEEHVEETIEEVAARLRPWCVNKLRENPEGYTIFGNMEPGSSLWQYVVGQVNADASYVLFVPNPVLTEYDVGLVKTGYHIREETTHKTYGDGSPIMIYDIVSTEFGLGIRAHADSDDPNTASVKYYPPLPDNLLHYYTHRRQAKGAMAMETQDLTGFRYAMTVLVDGRDHTILEDLATRRDEIRFVTPEFFGTGSSHLVEVYVKDGFSLFFRREVIGRDEVDYYGGLVPNNKRFLSFEWNDGIAVFYPATATGTVLNFQSYNPTWAVPVGYRQPTPEDIGDVGNYHIARFNTQEMTHPVEDYGKQSMRRRRR